jgi:hypothetical protein
MIFFGGGHTREVTTTSFVVAIVQDSVSFVDGKTSSKNSVDPASIENIFDEEISRGLMENELMIILRDMRPKLLCMKVDKEVFVSGVIRGDEEEVFIGEILIDGGRFIVRGKSRNEFGQDKSFLDLGSREL